MSRLARESYQRRRIEGAEDVMQSDKRLSTFNQISYCSFIRIEEDEEGARNLLRSIDISR